MITLTGLTEYAGTLRLLDRMVSEKVLEKHDVKHKEARPFYFLPSTDAPRIQSWRHEWDAANLYVALQDYVKFWTYQQNKEYLSLGFMPDRSSVLEIDGKPLVVFWERDEGTMKHEKVSQKIPGYIKLLRQRQDYPVLSFLQPRL